MPPFELSNLLVSLCWWGFLRGKLPAIYLKSTYYSVTLNRKERAINIFYLEWLVDIK